LKRIPELDALRGIALFGILLVNVFVFHAPLSYYGEFYGVLEGIQDLTVELVVDLAVGKFLFIFAFLFGYGMVLQQRSRPAIFSTYLTKRMLVLLLFGILHTLLFWFGDILTAYALLGLLAIPLLRLSNRVIFSLGAFFIFFRPLYYVGALYFDWPMVHMGKPVELDEFMAVFQHGSYWEIFQLRMLELLAFMPENLVWYLPKTAGLFLFGIYAARKELFTRIQASHKPYLAMALTFIVLSSAWYYYRLDLFQLIDLEAEPFWRPILISTNVLAETALGFGYIFGFSIIFQHSQFITDLLAKTGRLALTNYIMQSLFCVLIFYGYGLGYYGKLLPTDLVLITIAIFGFNVVFSALYLKYKNQGPLEYLWRRLIKM